MMNAPFPLRPGEPDCRDYLRTGRCKYGESCKYNHPTNVENGGGVKPTNPGEPLFPIRPMEPPCQYFLKHGTCKFGQACKFNHPSGSPLADGSGGIPAGQLVFVTSNNGVPGGAITGDASSLMAASTSIQVLPQRPTEPNCIYFLRNGKCKYGPTCKFHHPLDAINNKNNNNNIRRDRSHSAGSLSDNNRVQQMQQQQITYAHAAANVTYVQQQPQRLQPITERRPQQATHILLPDGQIAVILDPKSLQNVSELNVQDRPKFYLSQTNGSVGTLPSNDQQNNHNQQQQHCMVSPMLTATTAATNSTSNLTFDSNISDLVGTNVSYQGQLQDIQSRGGGPHRSGSGGSLSAYGSESDYPSQQNIVSSQVPLHQQMPNNNNNMPSFPQYSAWPLSEGLMQPSSSNQPSSQEQVLRGSQSSPEALDRQQQRHVANLESTAEDSAAYYWPSSGSFSSIQQQQQQAGRNYLPNSSSPYGSRNAVGSERRRPSISPSSSGEQINRGGTHENNRQESDEGLSMMTSALLTMIDHRDSPSGESESHGQPRGSPNQSSLARRVAHHQNASQSAPNLHDERSSHMRPPPGMMIPPGMSNNLDSSSSNYGHQNLANGGGGGGYFVGGYDQPARSNSPPWGGR